MSVTNIDCTRLPDNISTNLEDKLKEYLGLDNFQTYFPILSLYYNFYNTRYSETHFIFKSKYVLSDIYDKIEFENKESYIKHLFNGQVRNNFNGKLEDKKIFMKMNSIVDVLPYIMNDYLLRPNPLPNIFSYSIILTF